MQKNKSVRKKVGRKTKAEILATYDGSEPLWNTKHEIMVQEYMCNGYSKKKAYQRAYGRTDEQIEKASKRRIWSSYFSFEEVKRRMRWILNERRERFENGGGKKDLIEILKRRVLATPRDYMDWGPDDDGAITASVVPSELVDAIGLDSIEVMPTQYGDRIKIKVAKKEDVIELIAKLEGMIVDKHNLNASFEVKQNQAANEAYRKRLDRIAKKKKGKTCLKK